MSDKTHPDRTRTYNLDNFNMAVDALQRASRIASVYDMSDLLQQVELKKALNAEMTLARNLMVLIETKRGRNQS